MITHNSPGSEGAALILCVLLHNKTLEKLYLSFCDIEGVHLNAILSGLMLLAQLKEMQLHISVLDISNNPLGPIGTSLIADIFHANTNLTNLNLKCCGLDSVVLVKLGKVLMVNGNCITEFQVLTKILGWHLLI